MSNPRLEELRDEISASMQYGLHYDAEEVLKEYELLLELEFLKRLVAE